jgi:hypothetical protein
MESDDVCFWPKLEMAALGEKNGLGGHSDWDSVQLGRQTCRIAGAFRSRPPHAPRRALRLSTSPDASEPQRMMNGASAVGIPLPRACNRARPNKSSREARPG